jgi:hypothetical protein
MSAGVDAMGVAVRLTPALIILVAAGLVFPAVSEPAGPEPAAAAEPAAATELIDPDCYPEWAKGADPALLEEPDGVCPPGSLAPPSAGGAKPEAGPESDAEPAPAEQPASPVAPETVVPEGSPPPARTPGAESPGRRTTGDERGRTEAERRRQADAERRRAAERDRRQDLAERRTAERRRDLTERRRSAERHRVELRRRLARRRAATRRAALRRRRELRETLTPLRTPRFPDSALRASLPDPLPPARRLDADFAKRLERVAERSGVAWELMLAVLRARGRNDRIPASRERLRALARRLAGLGARKHPRRAVRRLAAAREPARRRGFVQRVVALAHYNRAVRLAGLVRGLKAVKKRLVRRVLGSRRLSIYGGGRADVESGFTDVRVLVLLLYLSSRSSEVTVSSLTTGHGFLTASGNVSLHSHGRAVDIAAMNGTPILGNQGPGGLTERTLRNIMLLPKRLQPTELISLFELGGPSFALADHADHIHVGY